MTEVLRSAKRERKSMSGSDQVQTPGYALAPLLPYLRAANLCHIWEPAAGKGNLVRAFDRSGFLCHADDIEGGKDFLKNDPLFGLPFFEAIVTNPPYSQKDAFLSRCYELGKPFALLLPTESLGGLARGRMFAKHGIELLVPMQRIDFEMPHKPGGTAWFHTSWFTWGLNIGRQITHVDLQKG